MNKKLLFTVVLGVSLCTFAQDLPDTVSVSLPETEKPSVSFSGQATGWSVLQFTRPLNTQPGARFVPTFTGKYGKLDAEVSGNMQLTADFSGTKHDTTMYTLKPYRVWLRYSGDNWEIRGGLQKINFGTAKMFRPLMWFDRMDVRDPLQLTDGVYALLGRYFFDNNANIWLWSLIGNDKPKGLEMVGSAQWLPEIGGRFQFPTEQGEMAFTTHYRKADAKNISGKTLLNETRFGADGKWDVGIGLWFEASSTITEKNHFEIPRYRHFLNVGADYTLPVGNGLGMTAEYFRAHFGNRFFTNGTSIGVAGAMLNYPLSILDDVSAMFFFVGEKKLWFNYLSYKRTYNNLQIYLIGFWNPETNLPIASVQSAQRTIFAGKGIQLMINYNF